jgi:hypothetical protein
LPITWFSVSLAGFPSNKMPRLPFPEAVESWTLFEVPPSMKMPKTLFPTAVEDLIVLLSPKTAIPS